MVKGEEASPAEKRLAILEEEFKIENIRCYCILGINPWERVEKQAVHISLTFNGPALQQWGSKFVDTYQKLTLEVAEVSYGPALSFCFLLVCHVNTSHYNSVWNLHLSVAWNLLRRSLLGLWFMSLDTRKSLY